MTRRHTRDRCTRALRCARRPFTRVSRGLHCTTADRLVCKAARVSRGRRARKRPRHRQRPCATPRPSSCRRQTQGAQAGLPTGQRRRADRQRGAVSNRAVEHGRSGGGGHGGHSGEGSARSSTSSSATPTGARAPRGLGTLLSTLWSSDASSRLVAGYRGGPEDGRDLVLDGMLAARCRRG